MTLQELYQKIDGDYVQAARVLRMDKLIEKHIRKLISNEVAEPLLQADLASMTPTQLFEVAHAVKGVCGNLGLTKLSSLAAEIADEFRPGHTRELSDEEVQKRISAFSDLYTRTKEGIKAFEGNA